jgi:hypothetical protein
MLHFKSISKLLFIISVGLSTNCTNAPISSSNPVTNTGQNNNTNTPANTATSAPNTSVKPTEPSTGSSVSPGQTTTPGNTTTTVGALSLPGDFLKVSDVDFYSVSLAWTAKDGAKSYKIYQDGKLVADNVSGINLKINDLTPQTDYVFEIVAVNEAGESNKAGIQVRTYIPSSSGGSGFVAPATPATSGNVSLNGGYN